MASDVTIASESVTLAMDRGTLLLRGLSPARVQSFWPGDIWRWDHRVGAFRAHALYYADVRKVLSEAFAGRLVDQVPPAARVAFSDAQIPVLRPEQRDAVDRWRQSNGRGLIVMPTGTGKTEVALAIMAESRIATLVVAPVRDLMYQWHQRILRRLGYDAGLLGDARHVLRPVTVTTYDSAYLHMSEIGHRFGLVIFDEAHHLPGKCYREAALTCPACLRLGLTATPHRADGAERDLEWLIGPLVYEQPIAHAKGASLADYNVVRIPVKLAEDEQARYEVAGQTIRSLLIERRQTDPKYAWENVCADAARDPAARQAMLAFHLRKSIEDRAKEKLRVLEDIFRLHVGERVLVFAGSNAMARDVSRRFLVPTLLHHSGKTERREVLEGFATGRFPVLVANQVLDEGVDVPEAKVAVVIGGQASPRQAKQRLGRILRRSGAMVATLYEVVVEDTGDVERSRSRRRSDAYTSTRRWPGRAVR